MRFDGAPELLEDPQVVLADRPAKNVLRLTLYRPHRRNALSPKLRAQLIHQLQMADCDPTVAVTIIRGSGPDFSAGYDLSFEVGTSAESFSDVMDAPGDGQFQRGAVNTVLLMWDLRKPVITQVHGHALAGGSEIASAGDLVYVAHSARVGYPPTRSMGCPDTQYMPWLCGFRKGMELMLTGDTMDAEQCVACGWANGSFPDATIDDEVLKIAVKVARVPADIQQINKRSVHRAMEVMGIRTALRYGTELQALVMHSKDSQAFMRKFRTTELPSANFQHYKFTPRKLRDGRTGDAIDVVHIDRLKLRHKQKATAIPADQGVVPCKGRCVVVSFPDGPVRVDEISFTTASDHPEWDPLQWLFEGSDDGETWTVLQNRNQDFPTPTKRLFTSGVLGLDGGKASKAFTERDREYGDNRIQRRSML